MHRPIAAATCPDNGSSPLLSSSECIDRRTRNHTQPTIVYRASCQVDSVCPSMRMSVAFVRRVVTAERIEPVHGIHSIKRLKRPPFSADISATIRRLRPCNTLTTSSEVVYSMHYIWERSLTYKGSHLWNRLPESLKLIQSTPLFKSSLTVFLLTTV